MLSAGTLLGTQLTVNTISWPPTVLGASTPHQVLHKVVSRFEMCKFTHRLFVFALLQLISLQYWATAVPVPVPASGVAHKIQDQQLLTELLDKDYDYDLHYDQRQKGSENLRVKLDGFFVGLPAQDTSGFLLLTDDILEAVGDELMMGFGKSYGGTSSSISTSTRPSTKVTDGVLNINKMAPEIPPLSPPVADMQTIIIEIPPSQKEFEGRQHLGSEVLEEGGGIHISRTKGNILHLLNFLRGTNKGLI